MDLAFYKMSKIYRKETLNFFFLAIKKKKQKRANGRYSKQQREKNKLSLAEKGPEISYKRICFTAGRSNKKTPFPPNDQFKTGKDNSIKLKK